MPSLNISAGSCTRVLSKNSTCTLCLDVCPLDAISFQENIPLVLNSCVDCGGCISICPSAAISLPSFDTIEFIFSFLEDEEKIISCKKNIPCLAALSVEDLISIAILKDEPVLDLGHCQECEIADPLFENIKGNIKECNTFLQAVQSDKKISTYELSVKKECPQTDELSNRREFLKRFTISGAVKTKAEFDTILRDDSQTISINDSQNIRKKELPGKRKLFFMALKRLIKPDVFHTFTPDELSFISNKSIDTSCDNCSLCYRICPVNALQSDSKGSKILFDPLLCIKCSLCHDVCEKKSITLTTYSTRELFEPKAHELINFKTIRCRECANFFTYFEGEEICPRCRIEEDEAKTLWGIR